MEFTTFVDAESVEVLFVSSPSNKEVRDMQVDTTLLGYHLKAVGAGGKINQVIFKDDFSTVAIGPEKEIAVEARASEGIEGDGMEFALYDLSDFQKMLGQFSGEASITFEPEAEVLHLTGNVSEGRSVKVDWPLADPKVIPKAKGFEAYKERALGAVVAEVQVLATSIKTLETMAPLIDSDRMEVCLRDGTFSLLLHGVKGHETDIILATNIETDKVCSLMVDAKNFKAILSCLLVTEERPLVLKVVKLDEGQVILLDYYNGNYMFYVSALEVDD